MLSARLRSIIGGLAVLVFANPALSDEALLTEACGACHQAEGQSLSRIEGQRKTPEGWLMTIVRMRIMHGMSIGAADQAALVRYLADTQGMAPSETAGWRYALERDPAAVEAVDEPLGSMCGRCHTNARVALQRRTAEEWRLHMDFHVGQFPTIEYQAGGRDRAWYSIARDEIAPMLATAYPFETGAWAAWQAAPKRDPGGVWIVLTRVPGKGEAYGRLSVAGSDGRYEILGEMRYADGTAEPVTGQMNLYTGFEWRANLTVGDRRMRQVLALSEDGTRLAGRQFLVAQDSLGGPITGVREDAGPAVLGAVPSAVPAGSAAPVQLVGTGLDGMAAEGLGGPAAGNPFGAEAVVASGGNATIRLGAGGAVLGVYQSLDRVAVEPAFTIARVGGGSETGPARVPAEFQAIGYWNGPDGQPGTPDDIRIGEVPATWSTANHGEAAEAMNDAAFAGKIDAATGMFMPAVAGPNPVRPFTTNNAGDLAVKAEALGLTGEARLIVTVQRFIDPPIR